MPVDTSTATTTAHAGALARLGVLRIPAYVADNQVHGRLRIDARKFASVEGLVLERNHAFVMHGSDALVFVPPSPLSLMPPLNIAGLGTERDVVARLETFWAARAEELTRALARARRLAKTATWSTEPLALEAKTRHGDADIALRFSEDAALVWVVELDGVRLAGVAAAETASCAASLAASASQIQEALTRGVAKAREHLAASRGGRAPEASDSPGPLAVRPGLVIALVHEQPSPPPSPEVGVAEVGVAEDGVAEDAWVVRAEAIVPEASAPALGDVAAPSPPESPPPDPTWDDQAGQVSGRWPVAPVVAEAAPAVGASWPAFEGEHLASADPGPPRAAQPSARPLTADLGAPRLAPPSARPFTADLGAPRPTPPSARPFTADLGAPRPRSESRPGPEPRPDGRGPDAYRLAPSDPATGSDGLRGLEKPRSGDLPLAPVGAAASPPPLEHVATADLRVPLASSNGGWPPPPAPLPSAPSPERAVALDSDGPDADVAAADSFDSLPEIEPLSGPPPLPPDEPDVPDVPVVPLSSRELPSMGPFDDPFRVASPRDDALDGDEPTAYVARPKRVEVDGAAVLRVRGRALAARVYNLSATGVFIAVDLDELPVLGEEVELGAAGYRPVRASVMHGRPRDARRDVPAGLGLRLLTDPAARHATTIPHVLLVSPDPEVRRKLAAVVAGGAMLPVPASDVVAAYVATHTMPVSVLVLDPAVQPIGDWRDLAEGFGVAQRGTPVIALQEPGRRLRGLPAWIVPATLEGMGRALGHAIGRGVS